MAEGMEFRRLEGKGEFGFGTKEETGTVAGVGQMGRKWERREQK